jgi:hypothetical protein
MKKIVAASLLALSLHAVVQAQSDKFWSVNNQNRSSMSKDKATTRLAFPKTFMVFNLQTASMRQALFAIVNNVGNRSTIISLPNADGALEQFEVTEASNFEPALQAQYPNIRAFSGRGITDKQATLKLSFSPQGLQTMIFRTDRETEFIEPYSQDHTAYAVYKSQREAGKLPWTCGTLDQRYADDVGASILPDAVGSSAGTLKTMRLAQSVTAEYSNYFGATSASQSGLVLAAVNATLTRCNGVYEREIALHLNLVAASTSVFYYNPSTDPYSPASSGAGGAWNNELQTTLTNVMYQRLKR